MSHTSEALSDTSQPDVTDDSEQQLTASEFATVLDNLTAEQWSVEEVSQKPSQVVAEPPIFTAVLEHENGSLVQVIPADSKRYSHDGPQFDSHRIRLRNKDTDESVFVTSDTISNEDRFIHLKGYSIADAADDGDTELPVKSPPTEITVTEPQASVYEADEEATEKGHVETAISHATLAIVAATRRVDQENDCDSQAGLTDF